MRSPTAGGAARPHPISLPLPLSTTSSLELLINCKTSVFRSSSYDLPTSEGLLLFFSILCIIFGSRCGCRIVLSRQRGLIGRSSVSACSPCIPNASEPITLFSQRVWCGAQHFQCHLWEFVAFFGLNCSTSGLNTTFVWPFTFRYSLSSAGFLPPRLSQFIQAKRVSNCYMQGKKICPSVWMFD